MKNILRYYKPDRLVKKADRNKKVLPNGDKIKDGKVQDLQGKKLTQSTHGHVINDYTDQRNDQKPTGTNKVRMYRRELDRNGR